MEFMVFVFMIFTVAFGAAELRKCFKVTDLVKGQCTFNNSTSLSPDEQRTHKRHHDRTLQATF